MKKKYQSKCKGMYSKWLRKRASIILQLFWKAKAFKWASYEYNIGITLRIRYLWKENMVHILSRLGERRHWSRYVCTFMFSSLNGPKLLISLLCRIYFRLWRCLNTFTFFCHVYIILNYTWKCTDMLKLYKKPH